LVTGFHYSLPDASGELKQAVQSGLDEDYSYQQKKPTETSVFFILSKSFIYFS